MLIWGVEKLSKAPTMLRRNILRCVVALSALAFLAACEQRVYVGAEQFEKVKSLCEKNNGLQFVVYFTPSDEGGGGKRDVPYFAYCNDGARFLVLDEIKKMSKDFHGS
ncbi:MAG TPA: hypothetical protein VJB70_03020 [Candidatus Paceibacterota bacterium]